MFSGNQLYKFDAPQKVQPREWRAMWPYMKGKTQLAILIRQADDQESLSSPEEEMLQNMLKAVDLPTDKAWIARVPQGAQFHLKDIAKGIPLKHLVAVGLEPADVHLHLKCEPYQLIELNGVRITFTDPIDHLVSNKTLKMSLWNTLQKMFDLA